MLLRATAAARRAPPLARGLFRVTQRALSGDHHGPVAQEPPHWQLPLPSKPLHEEDELIWNDGVAPETSIDFDAPHIPTWQGVAMWLGGLGFFASLLAGVSLTRPREGRVTDARELPAAIMNATYPRGPV